MACVIPFTQRGDGDDTARACNRMPRGLHSAGKKQRGEEFSTLELGRGHRPRRENTPDAVDTGRRRNAVTLL
jgi:hypothetical protein